MANLCTYFDKTGVAWNDMTTQRLVTFIVKLNTLYSDFYFPSSAGLNNMKSNMFTLMKEISNELENRSIKYEY